MSTYTSGNGWGHRWPDGDGLCAGHRHHWPGRRHLRGQALEGEQAGRTPGRVNSKIEFAINLKTAKALGLTIAPEVLFQADRLIR